MRSTSARRNRRAAVHVLVALTVAVAGLALAPTATAAPAAAGSGVVTGTVTGVDGRPLQGVTVTMARYFVFLSFPPQVTTYASDVTGADGRYRLRVAADQDQGALLLQFRAGNATGGTSATGYTDRCFGGGSDCLWSAKPGRAFTIVAGQNQAGVDVTLGRAGEVRGRVTDALGRGVGGLPVDYAVGFPSEPGEPENYQQAAAATVTDPDGNYRLRQLPAESGGVCFGEYSGSGSAGAPARDGYTSRCEPGVVPAAGRVTTLDVTVAGRGALVGRVVDSAGRPIAGAGIADYTDAADGIPRYATTTGSDGTFRLSLAAGTRTWCIDADRYRGVCGDGDTTVRPFRVTSLGTVVLQRAS